jgi:hypothetical protein
MLVKSLSSRASVRFIGATCLSLMLVIGVRPVRADVATSSESHPKSTHAAVVPQPVGTAPRALAPSAASIRADDLAASGIVTETAAGAAAAAGTGPVVYRNEIFPPPGVLLQIWEPGVAQFMADDLELASGACSVTGYTLAVAGFGESGPTFDIQVSLWDGDPCAGGSMYPGSDVPIEGIANNGQKQVVNVPLAGPVAVTTDIVWLQVSFSASDAGWIVAEEAEIGYSRDLFSENDLPPPDGAGCTRFFFEGTPPASFWATITCDLSFDPPGACCDGATCSEITESECAVAGGAWLGAYTNCAPSPCVTGACCSEQGFTTCTDTTEAQCVLFEGLFDDTTTCASEPCGAQYHVYRNNRPIAGLHTNDTGTILADDQLMAAGAPCDLASYDLDVSGLPFTGAYDVTAELWTMDEITGYPVMPIPGTRRVFENLGDGAYHRLLAGPFEGVTLPAKVWMIMFTSTDDSGWLIGQQATLGTTTDVFAVYTGMGWDLADLTDPPLWSGFRGNVRCYGTGPTGACCNDLAGTCLDDVAAARCEGRWVAGGLCSENPFDPPCGVAACCTVLGGCEDLTPEQCNAVGGDSAPGMFCSDLNDECPRVACLQATEDCHQVHAAPACEDAFCCETVCTIDSGCCTNSWDSVCTQLAASYCQGPPANDHCADAEPITGNGTFPFDNTVATTDGPAHAACAFVDGDDQTRRDVWYCWTAPCTDAVYVQTCGLTAVDTKLNVYAGCDVCPPVGADLLTCNDDFCGYNPTDALQSQVAFMAQEGQEYLIRVGTFPGIGGGDPAPGGTGEVRITCGIPDHRACPGAGHCCMDTASVACSDDTCCDKVCACDPYCCEVVWDDACATTGYENSGCGAELLCTELCESLVCPPGDIAFVDPPSGVVDARQPHPPLDALAAQGIDTFVVETSPRSDDLSCWTLCETAADGSANAIRQVSDNGDGTSTVTLVRPITAGAVTTITYTDDDGIATTGVFTSHPANVNADSQSSPSDILYLVDYVNGVTASPWGLYSEDVDHSGVLGPPDILRVIDLLNGAGQFDRPWLNAWRPDCDPCCP